MRKSKNNDFVRVKLGMSQFVMAGFLGIPRSTLAMYERNERNLPVEAAQKMRRLEIMLQKLQQGKLEQPAAGIHTDIQKHTEKIKKQIKLQEQFCTHKKLKTERELKKTQDKHARSETGLQLLELLESEFISGSNKIIQSWIAYHKATTLQNIIRHNAASQVKLLVKIKRLHTEAQAWREAHDTL